MSNEGLTCAGHRFFANGDLLVAYHFPPWVLFSVLGLRKDVKMVIEEWAEPRCPECGTTARGPHCVGCGRG